MGSKVKYKDYVGKILVGFDFSNNVKFGKHYHSSMDRFIGEIGRIVGVTHAGRVGDGYFFQVIFNENAECYPADIAIRIGAIKPDFIDDHQQAVLEQVKEQGKRIIEFSLEQMKENPKENTNILNGPVELLPPAGDGKYYDVDENGIFWLRKVDDPDFREGGWSLVANTIENGCEPVKDNFCDNLKKAMIEKANDEPAYKKMPTPFDSIERIDFIQGMTEQDKMSIAEELDSRGKMLHPVSNILLDDMKETFDACYATAVKKNHDYDGTNNDPYANFRNSTIAGVSVERGIMVRMMDKVSRISTLLNKEGKVSDESIQDTLDDLINYTAILKSYLKNR